MVPILVSLLLWGQVPVQETRTLYVTPTEDNFEVYIAAAMTKKKVPVTVTKNKEEADFILTTTGVEIQKQSTGSKIARCLFMYCGGIEDRGSTSVEVTQGETVVWSYSVNKGRGQKNRQSLAEAIAKHFKSDFLKVR